MKKMSELTCKDIHSHFIIIDKCTNKNIIAEYCSKNKDKYSCSYFECKECNNCNKETHRFQMSYNKKLNINATMYPLKSQANFILQPIDLPFDVISIINQYIYEN